MLEKVEIAPAHTDIMKKLFFIICAIFLLIGQVQCDNANEPINKNLPADVKPSNGALDLNFAQENNFPYVRRYDRGYWGNDYSERISFLHGLEQNRGGIPY